MWVVKKRVPLLGDLYVWDLDSDWLVGKSGARKYADKKLSKKDAKRIGGRVVKLVPKGKRVSK